MKLKRLLPFAKPSQLLVCETDGFSLRAAVLARSESEIQVLHQAKTDQVDMAEALADVVNALKADGWKGGGSAILLSPSAFSTLVELPVNPQKPRPLPQMLELVRWEVEPLLSQNMTRWSVGYLLVGQGYMTAEQAQAVMDLQQGKPNMAGGLAMSDKYSLRRFGDLAVELGYIKRSQLNACLTGQEWLKADDEVLECAWLEQGPVEDVPGTFNWLVSCVNQSLLQRWADAFARHGVKLKFVYPLTGCSAALLPDEAGSAVVLEAHPGLGFALRLQADAVLNQRQYLNPHKPALDICLETYHALHVPPREPVWLSSWQASPTLADDLQRMLDIDVHELSDASLGEVVTPGMAGAGRQVLGFGRDGLCAGVRVGGPLPPMKDRLEVRAAVLLTVLLLIVGASELSLWLRQHYADSYKQDVDARWKQVDDAVKRLNGQIAEVDKRKQALRQLEAEQQHSEAMLNFYGNDIPERISLVKGLLGVLQSVADDEVVMISLDEPDKPTQPVSAAHPPSTPAEQQKIELENFKLEAWAMSEAAAQTFIQAMTDAVASFGLEIRDPKVSFGKGPLNGDGFAVAMRLVKRVEAAGKPANQPQ